MKRLLLLTLSIFVSIYTWAQCSIVTNASQTITLSGATTSGTPWSVAYSPTYQRYYSTNSGTGAPLFTYNSTGTIVSTVYPSPYKCGLWWNANTSQLESNAYSTSGLWYLPLNTSGTPTGSATLVYSGYNQPSTYSKGAYDYNANEILYMNGTTVYRYNRTNGTLIGTIALSGYTSGNINTLFIGFSGCSGKELVAYDYTNRRALFYNKSTGSFVGYSQLPATAFGQSSYGISYANNKIFINSSGTSWLGYDVMQSGITTSSISGPFCDGSTVSVNFTTDTLSFLSGNTFTAQLSSATGSFASPTTIGSVTSTTATTITATIPANTAYGANYRIRVVSSSPSYTGNDNGTDIIINVPTLNLGANQTLCSGSSMQLQGPAGATSYSWSTGSNSQNITITNAGTYSLTISNSVCSKSDTIVITGITAVSPTLSDTTSTCVGGSTTINATTSGVSSYLWSTGATTASITPSTSGYYFVTTTDNNSCTAYDSTFLSIVDPTITPGDTSVCLGESVDLLAISSSCYFELATLSNSGVGAVSVNYDDRGGIAVDDNFIYAQKDGATVKISKSSLSVVAYLTQMDGLFTDLATSSLYTLWNSTSNNFNYSSINAIRAVDQNMTLGNTINLSQTISLSYSALVCAGNGFVAVYDPGADDLFKIDLNTGVVTTLNNNLILSYTTTENWASWGVAECNANNEYTLVYRNGSYFYEYKTSNNTVSLNTSLTPGYTLSGDWGTFVYSSSDNRWYNSFEGSGIVGQSASEGVGYANATVTGATGTGATTIGITVSPTVATSYSVIVSDGISTCYDTVAISVNALPSFSLTDTISACNVDSVLITGPGSMSSYLWSDGSTTQNNYFSKTGTQWLKATNSNGCSLTDTTLISLVDARLNLSDTTVCSADSFRIYPENSVCGLSIQTMTTNNVNYRSTADDDRGGIAATPNYVYYNSQISGLIRFDANNISSGTMTALNVFRDGVFSDLATGQLYTLWYTSVTDFYYNTQYVNAVRKLDANGNYGAILNLSQTIPWNPTCCYYNGIFSGEGFLILWTDYNNTFYKIDLGNGQVKELGTGNLSFYNTDIYHFWGVAECNDENLSVVGRLGTYLARYDIQTAAYTNLSTNTLGSTGVIAYSPWKEKWYGYSESAFYLGSTYIATESLYEADATDINYGGNYSNLDYSWSTGDTTASIHVSPDTTTVYSLTITDGITTCYDTVTFTVIPSPEIASTVQDVLCNGSSAGNVDLTVSGGVSPYTYLWNTGSENDSITGLSAGTYTVTVTGSNSCVVPMEFTLTQPSAIASTLTQTQSASCFEANDGSAYVVASGGVSPYTYEWSSGETSDTANALNGDFNFVSITDNNGCVRVDSIDITSPAAIAAAGPLTTSNGFICPGGSTNLTAVNGSNGTGISTFTYTTAINEQFSYGTNFLYTISSVPTSINGNASATVYWYGDRSLSSEFLTFTIDNSYLIGQTSSMPYNYCDQWVSQTFSISQSIMQTIISDGQISITLSPNGNDYCSSLGSYGKAYIEISYPTSNERTFWFAGACQQDTASSIGHGSTINVSPTSTTKYYSMNYLDGCFSTCDSITVTVAPNFGLNFTVGTNPICPGNSTTISATGGANPNYVWTPNSSLSTGTGNSVVASPTATTAYDVQYTDFFGCSQHDTITINVHPQPLLNILSVNNASCNQNTDGYAAVFGSNGQSPYTYAWPTGASSALAFNLGAGNYIVTVTDAHSCQDTGVVTIGVNVDVNITNTSTNPSCFGAADGSINVTATGGSGPYTMSWSTGATTSSVSGLSAGLYTVTVTDNSGCYDSLIITLTDPAQVVASISNTENQSCSESNNGSVLAAGSGGNGTFTYLWSNGASTALNDGIAAGTYTVTVTDANSCTATTSATVYLVPSNLNASITQLQGLTCFGGNAASLGGSYTGGTGSVTYAWSNGSTTSSITSLASGTYILTVNDSEGCIDTTSYTITDPAPIVPTLIVSNVTCNGSSNGSISNTVVGGTSPYTYSWSNGATTQSLSNLAAGTYTVTVTDANSCQQSQSAIVTQPNALTISTVSITPTSCPGGNDAAIAITVTGGTTSYTYAWSNSGTNASISGIAAGNYTVTVTDANGCIIDSTISITPVANPIAITLNPTNVGCFGTNSGAISALVSGGTGPYTYSWSNGATSANISTLAAGAYTVTVTNSLGCTNTANATLNQPTALTTNIVNTVDQSCFGVNNGTATAAANGGTSPYNYTWPNGQTTAMATGLAAGNHIVTITDANGCSTTDTAVVGFTNSNLSASISLVSGVTCNGLSNASILGNATGGSGSISYSWSNGTVTSSNSGLSAGAYVLTVTDTAGCSATANFTVTQPNVLNVNLTNTSVICNGGNTGTISSTVTGGTSPFIYHWNNNASTASLAAASAGTYTVTVTDNKGCTKTKTTTVTQPTAITVNGVTTQQTTCAGGNDGALAIVASGGTGSLSYTWSNGSTQTIQSGLQSGNYTVTIKDANNCIKTQVVTIQPTDSIDLNLTIQNVTCFGSGDGSIVSSPQNGTTPYSFVWGNGSTSPSRVSLNGGTYPLTVTDSNGCTVSKNIVVTEATQPIVISSATSTNVACFGDSTGTATLNVNGGVTPYSFDWSHGDSIGNPTNLAAGTYQITITDLNGCIGFDTVSITQNPAIIISSLTGNDVTCYGGNDGDAAVVASGGVGSLSYAWSSGSNTNTASNLASDTHAVSVTDALGCLVTQEIVIAQPDSFLVQAALQDIACYGNNSGSISLTVTGNTAPYTYNWSNSASSANNTNIDAGSYAVTITDANGCVTNAAYTLTQPDSLHIELDSTNGILCNGDATGAIYTTTTGGVSPYTYSWSNNVSLDDNTGLSGGTYTLTVTDVNICMTTIVVNINEPASLLATVDSVHNISCNGAADGQGFVSVSGGTSPYTYAWSGTTQVTEDITNLTPGTYNLTVTDANGCSTNAQVNITEPAVLSVALSSSDDASCFGLTDGQITVLASGGSMPYNYSWSNGASNAINANIGAGSYTVNITDANGCTLSDNYSISQPTLLGADVVNVDSVTCYGNNNGQIEVAATGGTTPYSYSWSAGAGNNVNSGLVAGAYTVTITDNQGCDTVLTATVLEPDSITVQISGSDLLCNADGTGSASVSASGGTGAIDFIWNTGATSSNISGLMAGNYTVTISDYHNCIEVSTIAINEPTMLIATTSITAEPLCFGDLTAMIEAAATGGTMPYEVIWNTSDTVWALNNVAAGAYAATVTDANGCTISVTDTILQPSALSVSLDVTNNICSYDSTGSVSADVTGGTGNYSYVWANNDSTSMISGLAVGNYVITISDENGCSISDSATVDYDSEALPLNLPSEATVCKPFSITLDAGIDASSYLWSTGDTTHSIQIFNAGTYILVVSNAEGCLSSDSTIVIEQNCVGIDEVETNVAVELYPNPNRGEFTINISNGNSDRVSYSFLSIDGKLVTDGQIILNNGSAQENFQLDKVGRGIYFLNIVSENNVITKRVIIE